MSPHPAADPLAAPSVEQVVAFLNLSVENTTNDLKDLRAKMRDPWSATKPGYRESTLAPAIAEAEAGLAILRALAAEYPALREAGAEGRRAHPRERRAVQPTPQHSRRLHGGLLPAQCR